MQDLFLEYTKRIANFTPCEWGGPAPDAVKASSSRVWMCDLGPRAKTLSSEEIARELGRVANGGIASLEILIGPPNGFKAEDHARIKPDLVWSFGPLTLPHELAAVVASEQVYRAWTILRGHPYHGGH